MSLITSCDHYYHNYVDITGENYETLTLDEQSKSIMVETGLNIQQSPDKTCYTVENPSCHHIYPVVPDRSPLSNQCNISSSYLPTYLKRQNLGFAAYRCDIQQINRIINLGIIDINKRSETHFDPHNVKNGEKPTVLYLALNGFNDRPDNQGNKFRAFKLLADAGANIHQLVYSKSIFEHAIANQKTEAFGSEMEILKLLICRGLANRKDIESGPPHQAVSQLFSKYKQLIIASTDAHSSLCGYPLEVLQAISLLATRLPY